MNSNQSTDGARRFSQCGRRLHLDYHNPVGIPDIGSDFDAREFAATIREAGFDSATVFAQDAHGLCYFPTEVGIQHPGLKQDMLGQMLEGCHDAGISVGAYVAVGCNDYASADCYQVDKNMAPRCFEDQGGYTMICLNSPHITEKILPLTEELLRKYPVDAIWYDLLYFFDEGCRCSYCRQIMEAQGLDPSSPADMREHMRRTIGRFVSETATLAQAIRPEVEMTYNGLSVHERPIGIDSAAYVDVEALATGGWGYFYFPPKARYLRTLGKPVTGMTAAFHENWGDFGTIKSRAMLEYECYTFLAAGADIAIGDQLPPRGRLEKARYNRIGEVLGPIKDLAPWLDGAKPLAEAAIVLPPLAQGQFPSDSWAGACKLLMEAKVQFDTVDVQSDWSSYKLLVFPDEAYHDDDTKRKVAGYLASGGAILATGKTVDALPGEIVSRVGDDYSKPAYVKIVGEWAGGAPDVPHAVVSGFLAVDAPGADILGTITEPYASEGPRFHYSSPQIPYSIVTDKPAIVKSGRVIYLAAPLFAEYWKRGYGVHRQLLVGLIDQLLPEPVIKGRLPLASELAVMASDDRLVCLLVPYSPLRGECVEQIDEWPRLAGLTVGVRGRYEYAYLAPSRRDLVCQNDGAYTVVELPVVEGPQALVFELAKRE